MTPSTAELTRLHHMASIAKWTNDKNRDYHHAMIDAGWIPVVDMWGITQWGIYNPASLWDYQKAMDYYNEHGTVTPPPF